MTNTITITLTKDEAKVVSEYLFKKVCRLEDAGLRESYCYPRLYTTYNKLSKELKQL